ncbi:MAG: TOPRIM nucleotidyl transferase/hydrolase domain-containing protein [Clostridia bacterium]
MLLVDGESEWAALPIWYEQTFHEPLEAVGITLLCVQGKSGKGPAMDDLEQFRIPWVALVDGDSLRLDRNNIWKQLHRVGRLSKADADRAQRRKFPDAVCALRKGYGVFVAGATVDENFDTLIEQLIVEDDLLAELQVAEGGRVQAKGVRSLLGGQPPIVSGGARRTVRDRALRSSRATVARCP